MLKLEQQVNELDQEGQILQGQEKPEFLKSMHSGFVKKKNEIQTKISICN